MDKIEKQIRLPKGARPLGANARYYAKGDDGEIVAVYLIVPKPGPQPEGAVPPGKRRWFTDRREMPGMSGGGCGEVNVVYHTAKSTVTDVACNGGY